MPPHGHQSVFFIATDEPGHGSSPRATSSVSRIVHALNLIRENPFPARIIPAVDKYFKSLALNMNGENAKAFACQPRTRV